MVINALRSRERARYVPERRSHGGQPWSLTGNASAQTQVSRSAADPQVTAMQRHRLPKLIVRKIAERPGSPLAH